MPRSPEERDAQMTALMRRFSDATKGERIGDVMYACCALIMGCVQQMNPEAREAIKPIMDKFVGDMKEVDPDNWGGGHA